MTSTTPADQPYPVRVYAGPNGPPSRLLWLVKWLLLVPHLIVLIPLWIGFWLLTLVALVAIVATGSYPRWIFDFNLGVMRWSWRLAYYGYGVLGTDHYPPFTLKDVPDHPARLDIDYPVRLHRGLALVKWLLVLPHALILAILFGGGGWLGWQTGDSAWAWSGGGLVGLLVLISAVVLAFTGTYPRSLFGLVVGFNRWALRTTAYVALMTDRYPPFRLDLGATEPDTGPSTSDGSPTVHSTPALT